MLQVLYVPLNARGLIAGRYDGHGEEMLQHAGDPAVGIERIETGRYRLTVTDHGPENSILLLTNAGMVRTKAPRTAASPGVPTETLSKYGRGI